MTSPTTCTSCPSGQYLNGSVCVSPCPVGKYPDTNNVCQTCVVPCATCSTVAICALCSPNAYMLGTMCYNPCIDGYYGNTSNDTCTICSAICLTCITTASTCVTCNTALYTIDAAR